MLDPSAATIDALDAMLAPLGRPIVRAATVEAALGELGRREVALLLAPAGRGGIDGVALTAAVRARPGTRRLPIVLTADAASDGDALARAFAAGAWDVVTLPCDARVLRAKVSLYVDAQRRAEEHREQLAAIRRRDRERWEEQTAHRVRHLSDLMPLCVWAADRAGRITYCNKAWSEYTGLGLADANDRAHLAIIHPDDRGRVLAAWTEAVRRGEPLVVEYRLRRRADGAYRWHLGRAVPERSARGAIVGWIATATDIDDQKHAEERMAELAARADAARVEAEQASRMKDEFLATLSHELRTPLNAIYGWTRMLRAGELEPGRADKALQTIERNTRAQIKLVEDLLDVSRIIAGKLALDLRSVSPGDVVRTAVEAMMPAAEHKGVTLAALYDPTPCRIAGDPNRLQQVVWNLIANAIKFTPAGGRVDVVVGSVGDAVEIEVNDSGHGIDPAFLPHVFDAFRQADGSATRTHGGLGLGLAIVKHIVELHHGAVEVHSEGYGRGARFVVRLPRSDAAAGEPAADWPSRSSGSFAPVRDLGGVAVLVVDDDADAREMLQAVLERYGARVTTAATAGEAWAALQARRYDVLVSDVGMPGEDGHALIRRVREVEREEGGFLPAIALTGYATAEDGRRALAAGFQLHIAKPVDPAELLVLVSGLLDGHAGGGRAELDRARAD